MIGAGNFAKGVLIPALRKFPNVTLGGVVTSGGISARHAASKFGFAFAATDAASVLDDRDTNAVVIATRHASHARLTRMALEAGKHVFCEKPLALTSDELAERDASRRNVTRPTCGRLQSAASRPTCRQIKEMIAERAGPLMMSYRINAGTVPATSWLVGEEGGGRVVGEVCHFVDTMSYLAGAPVTRVSANRLEASAEFDHGDLIVRGRLHRHDALYVGRRSVASRRNVSRYSARIALRSSMISARSRCRSLASAGAARRCRATRATGHCSRLSSPRRVARAPPPMTLAEIANVTATTFAIEDALRTRDRDGGGIGDVRHRRIFRSI